MSDQQRKWYHWRGQVIVVPGPSGLAKSRLPKRDESDRNAFDDVARDFLFSTVVQPRRAWIGVSEQVLYVL